MTRKIINPKMQGEWFKRRLREINKSQAGLAKHLGYKEPSIVSFMISGQQRIRLEDIEKIASFLEVSYDEILERTGGLKVPKRVRSAVEPKSISVELVGAIDGNMQIIPRHDSRSIIAPADLPQGITAYVMQTAATPAAFFDGWVMFAGKSASIETLLGLCVVTLDDGSQRLGAPRRGYSFGRFNLLTPFSVLEDLPLKSASPIILIRP